MTEIPGAASLFELTSCLLAYAFKLLQNARIPGVRRNGVVPFGAQFFRTNSPEVVDRRNSPFAPPDQTSHGIAGYILNLPLER